MITLKELSEEYIKLFVLIVETAGQQTNNESYKNVEEIIKKSEKAIKQTIEEDFPFSCFVASLIFYVVIDVHGADKLDGLNEEETKELVDDFWNRYMKKPTRKFTSKYGLPIIEDLNTYIKLIKR